MKNTKQCPKCENKKIIVVDRPTVHHPNSIQTGWLASVTVHRYVCNKCGYSEEWINSAEELQQLEKRYPLNKEK